MYSSIYSAPLEAVSFSRLCLLSFFFFLSWTSVDTAEFSHIPFILSRIVSSSLFKYVYIYIHRYIYLIRRSLGGRSLHSLLLYSVPLEAVYFWVSVSSHAQFQGVTTANFRQLSIGAKSVPKYVQPCNFREFSHTPFIGSRLLFGQCLFSRSTSRRHYREFAAVIDRSQKCT